MRNQKNTKKTAKQQEHAGVISLTARGTGFIETSGFTEDVIIDPSCLNTALNNDEVRFSILPKKTRGRRAGRVLAVIKRSKTRFVGTLERKDGKFFLVPDDVKMYARIAIDDRLSSDAAGNKALVEMFMWKNAGESPRGKIIKIIGRKGNNNVEMEAIVLGRGFSAVFPAEVENEAERMKMRGGRISDAEIAGRRDFRDTLTFTIDPADAKDFDDAISFRKLPGGNLEIGVHIADVSHFVREHSVLDREARKRGFSVYLVDRTIPMLPEALSNEVCSLNPNEDRLTFSAVFEMTSSGAVRNRWFGKTVIHSAKRFTYEEAQAVLAGKSAEHREALQALNGVAKKLREEKFSKGAVDFEQDEVRFELDDSGKPVRIFKKERLDTHKLVEEFMLLANKEVAEFIYRAREKKKSSEPFIYRVHDLPDRERIANLGMFVRALGYELPLRGGNASGKDLQALFEKLSGRAEESMIKTAAVRSMAKAVYSTVNIGHFGLSFEYYTHFTSPIRRYADLLVHRLLDRHLSGIAIPSSEWRSYETMARENTEQEIAAAEAERESRKYKQVEYMQSRIGETFDGIVSGVTEWGMYIEEVNTRSEGMVKLRDLQDDYYVLDEKTYSLVGEKTKKRFSLGDKARFRVVGADVERRTLDYALV